MKQEIDNREQKSGFTGRQAIWTILLLVIPLFFYKLGSLAFVGPDEPRYAQVAREMFSRHDWVTPTLLGDTWFEKPALLYWMMIGFYHLIGVNEWAARLPNALFATLNLFIIYRITQRAGGYGFWSAVSLAGCALYLGLARAASFDMPLTFTFTAALAAFHLADTSTELAQKRKYLCYFYAAIGLSLLAKGLVGIVLIGTIVGLYIILSGQLRQVFSFHPFAGLLIILLVAASWYGLVIYRNGWPFIDEFFIQHHFQRYTSNKYHHPGPVYFFLLIILGGAMPWTLFLISSVTRRLGILIKEGKGYFASLQTRIATGDKNVRLLLLVTSWIMVPLLFFSFSNSKLPGYILPVFPAVAVIIGRELDHSLRELGLKNRWLVAQVVLMVLFAIALAFFAAKEFQADFVTGSLLVLPAAISAILLFIGSLQRKNLLVTGGLVLTSPLLAIALSTLLFPFVENKASLAPLSRMAASQLSPGEKVLFFNYLQYTPFFYTNGQIVEGEKGDAAYVNSVEGLMKYLNSYPSLLCIMREQQLAILNNDARLEVSRLGNQRDIVLVRVKIKQLN